MISQEVIDYLARAVQAIEKLAKAQTEIAKHMGERNRVEATRSAFK